MTTIKAPDVHAAIALAKEFQAAGRYDWFRGQSKNYRLVSSLNRLDDEPRAKAIERANDYWSWVRQTPGLENLAASLDEAIAVAQHHGIKTNFVDFTTDPEVAGFFAMDSETLVPGQTSVIICLDTEDLIDFWTVMPLDTYPAPELLRLDVSNLWRLQAQSGVFLYCPYADVEQIYDFDRIVFPATTRADEAMRAQMYPPNKSQLELLLDQYFMLEKMREGMEAWKDITHLKLDFGAPDLNPDLVDASIPELPSWSSDEANRWRLMPDERLSAVRQGHAEHLRVNVGLAPQEVVRDIAEQVAAVIARAPGIRGRLVDWRCEIEGRPDIDTASVELPLRWLWDGLRSLPHSDEDLAAGFGTTVSMWVASKQQPVSHHPWEAAASAVLGDVTEVEFGAADGSYSRGYARDADLLACVRGDIEDHLAPAYRAQVAGSAHGMLQAVQVPSRLFEFDCLARLMARQLAPTQVLIRVDVAAFFSPAHLTRIGLP